MPGRIPDNILEDVLNRTDIVEVISHSMPLKRSGRNFKACCPFHHEKTASFMVSPERQIYHCFGCGESGNAFKFLMRHERLDFPEAVETLAKKAGVTLPQAHKQDAGAENLSTQLFKINELTAQFYQNNLKLPASTAAKEYLFKRGIKQESVDAFKLGVATDHWDALISHLRSKGVPLSLLEKAGLIIAKDSGGYYDRFRNRLIFTIFDLKSRVLGFGARVLDAALPKYINSPETAIYTKGRHLYGFNFSKDAIREADTVAIVEGYLDFIIPFQEGFKNIVASLGTALTTEQARLLKRYTHNVVMVYDADAAGELATLRSLDIFIEEEMNVKIVSLPKGMDPDLFVRKNGAEAFRELVAQAKGLFEYKLGKLKSRYNYKDIEGKSMIAAQMLETISRIKNAVLRSEYIKKLSQELDIKEEALLEEARKTENKDHSREPAQAIQKKVFNISPVEKLLIKLMLEESDLISKVKEDIDPSDFQDERTSRIVSMMFDLMAQGKSVDARALINHFGDEEVSQLICESMFMPDSATPEHKEKVVDDCLRRMKSDRLVLKKHRLEDEIRRAQDSGDQNKLGTLMEEFHNLIKKG